MKTNDFARLEKDQKFKKKYLPKNLWIKTYAIYPPAGVIFTGLAGLIYLLNHDILVSVYAIPFVVLLLLGAVWLKAVRRHTLNTLFEKKDSYLVCLGRILQDKNGWVYVCFSTSDKRHERHFIDNISKDIINKYNDIPEYLNSLGDIKKNTLLLPVGTSGDIYARAFAMGELNKVFPGWKEENYIPLLYINKDNLSLIKRKDISQ